MPSQSQLQGRRVSFRKFGHLPRLLLATFGNLLARAIAALAPLAVSPGDGFPSGEAGEPEGLEDIFFGNVGASRQVSKD